MLIGSGRFGTNELSGRVNGGCATGTEGPPKPVIEDGDVFRSGADDA